MLDGLGGRGAAVRKVPGERLRRLLRRDPAHGRAQPTDALQLARHRRRHQVAVRGRRGRVRVAQRRHQHRVARPRARRRAAAARRCDAARHRAARSRRARQRCDARERAVVKRLLRLDDELGVARVDCLARLAQAGGVAQQAGRAARAAGSLLQPEGGAQVGRDLGDGRVQLVDPVRIRLQLRVQRGARWRRHRVVLLWHEGAERLPDCAAAGVEWEVGQEQLDDADEEVVHVEDVPAAAGAEDEALCDEESAPAELL
mmetsp:Transcript_49147/g.158822  ORF Transcript_49147/g.158822 Transcript_49147/m.158822 type:complete len:258 (+) Transcript_49147:1597-2370(+)